MALHPLYAALQGRDDRPLSKAIPSDSLAASGADPSILNTRSRSIANPPAAPKCGGRGFLPLSPPLWCSANRNALVGGYPSESVAWIMEKPRTLLARGLPIGTNSLVFR